MSVSKEEFVKIMEQRIESDPNQLNIPNAQLVKFVNDFVDTEGSKFLDYGLINWAIGILFWGVPMIFRSKLYPKAIVHELDHGKAIDLDKLYAACSEWIDIDINNEIPLLFHKIGTLSPSCVLLTNTTLYYNMPKSKKSGDARQPSMGKIDIADITQFDTKPHSIMDMITIIVNGNEIGAFNCKKAHNRSANNLRKMLQSIIMKKNSLIG
ncbi:hypothetical protein [Pseudodesulfovibrio sediminis]|uniref:YokE-like PH domain-containing protein n=1 Tax=Pseudodesulfovibrio sediminis TaxID=2810563 RepID=A0ABN6ESV9_9BACT|nr:hypothetical protein [Pseudodesulfovibrio sediminis]BCS88179.1 hypothetical protein PSDVSF_14210 [Pseudodesulfovibrio sediminis]